MLIFSCGNSADVNTRNTVDSLNELSLSELYNSASISEKYARQALDMSEDYEDGQMEAMCNLAQVYIMKMQYDSAKVLLQDVLNTTHNSLYKFYADTRMMKICQVIAANKEFYEYRTDADLRIERIAKDEGVMNRHQRVLWKVSNFMYNLTLASHYHNLRYEDEMEMAHSMFLDWYQALGVDTVLISSMIKPHSLEFWKKYGNLYYESMSLIHIADTLSMIGNQQDALDSLDRAMQCINKFHGFQSEDSMLVMFDMANMDSIPLEMKMILDPDIVTIPEWLASIREQLSIVYGALGMKEASDYNRNVYMDILDATCKDQSLAERQERLEHEDKMLDILLFTLLLIAVFVVGAIVIISRRGNEKSSVKSEKLSRVIDVCTKMTAAMPKEAVEDDDVCCAVREAVDDDVKSLFPDIDSDWAEYDSKNMERFDREMLSVLQVLYRWIKTNSQVIIAMTEESERVEGERYLHEKHIDDNKRQYVDKATSVSIATGITPFLDRAIREVNKLKVLDIDNNRSEVEERLQYVKELVEKIEAFNEVLGHWVKIRQGAVTLNIENFAIQPLLDTLAKGKTMFEAKNISLEIPDSDAVVKADNALTLFMMNTLIDNARKYTPEGGTVKVTTEVTDEYVEVSVKDSGAGLSPEDCDVLNNNKVYDSSKIGVADDKDGQVTKNKGFGFGLMNCRGIIEKYRKTNAIFGVCAFGVESTLGEGSRFYFRLPKGVVRTFMLIAMMLIPSLSFAEDKDHCDNLDDCIEIDNAMACYDSLLECNKAGEYERAIEFADSAIMHLNHHYYKEFPDGTLLMKLYSSDDDVPELILYKMEFDTDYDLIASIRNEVAVSALALNERPLYHYNNELFNRLTRQIYADRSLEDYCNSIQETTTNKQVTFTLAAFFFLVLILIYMLMYYRHNLLYVFNMRQFLQFAHRLFSSDSDTLISCLGRAVNEVRTADAIGVAMVDVDSNDDSLKITYSGVPEYHDTMVSFLESCYKHQTRTYNERERFLGLPLMVNVEGESRCVGVLGIVLHDAHISKNDELNLQLITQFYAMHSYFCSTRVDEQRAELELRMDEMRKTEQEDSKIHIQNMVLDNYLSTIKHETMYYPGRIRQIAESALKEPNKERLKDLAEITCYYKEVFTLLSSGASKQLEKKVFRREKVSVADLAKYAKRTFDKRNRKEMLPIRLEIINADPDLYVMTDKVMANYIVDTLLAGAFQIETSGVLTLNFAKSERFVKFAFSDSRLEYTEEQLANLFYADSIKYDTTTGVLHGTQFLLLKQMVREHDEFSGHKGCRIYAESIPDGGTKINIEL